LIKEVKTKIVEDLPKKIPGISVGFGIADFRDWNEKKPEQIYHVDQTITTNATKMQNSLDNLPKLDGGKEPHQEAIYQAATGEGLKGLLHKMPFPQNPVQMNIPPADCSKAEGTIGGLCFRDMSMPVFIMITDEGFTNIKKQKDKPKWGDDYWDDNAAGHSTEDAITAMNGINAKFIGIDSGFTCNLDNNGNCEPGTAKQANEAKEDFKKIAQGTGSLDKSGKPFLYHTENPDGSGLSDQIADAIVQLTSYIQMDVTTKTTSEEKCNNRSVADFVVSSKPNKATPPDGISGKDDTTFKQVQPGTVVSFDIHFHNDFCLNKTQEPKVYNASIKVLGEGAFLSAKKIQVIIPAGSSK
jgi:hypothetical protein